MCGKYKISSGLDRIADLLHVPNADAMGLHGVIAPGMQAPVIRMENSAMTFSSLTWGFIPNWAKEVLDRPLINARAETLAEKPSFRDAFKSKRCLIPADSFFEWDMNSKPKRGYEISTNGDTPLAFAGIWDSWQPPEKDAQPIDTFAIVTIAAREPVLRIHDRMPLILSGADAMSAWVQGAHMQPCAEVLDMIAIAPASKKAANGGADPRQMSLF